MKLPWSKKKTKSTTSLGSTASASTGASSPATSSPYGSTHNMGNGAFLVSDLAAALPTPTPVTTHSSGGAPSTHSSNQGMSPASPYPGNLYYAPSQHQANNGYPYTAAAAAGVTSPISSPVAHPNHTVSPQTSMYFAQPASGNNNNPYAAAHNSNNGAGGDPSSRPTSTVNIGGAEWPLFDMPNTPPPPPPPGAGGYAGASGSGGRVKTHSTGGSSSTAVYATTSTNVEQDVPPCRYVVGLDFGTTQTGFGFCRVSNKKNSQPEIIANELWENQPQGTFSCKTPTILSYSTLDRSRKLFSWTAKMQGIDIQFERIERVKLCLEESIPDNMKPTLPEGMTAVDVIADFLAWIREELLKMIQQRYPMDRNLEPRDFLFCFTVPVGWSHKAHESLRRSAHKAGLIDTVNSKHLIFCYEPEAAALACVHESDYDIEPGSKMLVVDCGGGTVDLFLATLDENNDLEELTMSDGRFLGATRVDANFWNLIRQKIGLTAFERFKSKAEFRQYYTEMEWKWEYFKRQFTGKLHDAFMIQLPQPLLKIMPTEKVNDLQNGDLYLTEVDVKGLFDPVINEIIEVTKLQLQQARESGIGRINYLYVVGGFGCNAYVRKRVTEDPEIARSVDYPMLPRRPEAAVLRGAVWCAMNYQNIKSRKARKTIGIGVLRRFDPSRDQPSEIMTYDPAAPNDITRAHVSKSVFVYTVKGQSVAFNARYIRSGFCVKSPEQQIVNICIWGSDKAPAPGSTRLETEDCELIGTISIQLPPEGKITGQPPRFTIEISYGRVELGVRVVNEATGQSWSQFLNHGHFDIRGQ